MTSTRFAAIDYWQGLKTAAAIALVPIAAVTVQQLLGLGDVPQWVYLWGACAALIAVLPRHPAWLRNDRSGWRSSLLVAVFALILFPVLAAGSADAHGLVGSGMVAAMFGTVFAAAAWFSMNTRLRREQAAAAHAPAAAAASDPLLTGPAASRTPVPPPEPRQ